MTEEKAKLVEALRLCGPQDQYYIYHNKHISYHNKHISHHAHEAADHIEALEDDLRRQEAINAGIIKERIAAQRRIEALERENARLREERDEILNQLADIIHSTEQALKEQDHG